MKKFEDYKLCYMTEDKAYFTRKELEKQWGKDWNVAPYEHYAGEPYSDKKDDIFIVGIDVGDHFPGPILPNHFHYNSPYSVESINSGLMPWLTFYNLHGDGRVSTCNLYAGISLGDFEKKVRKNNGRVIDLRGKEGERET